MSKKATIDLTYAGLSANQMVLLYGTNDHHIDVLEKEFAVQIITNGELQIIGETIAVAQTKYVIGQMLSYILEHNDMSRDVILDLIGDARMATTTEPHVSGDKVISAGRISVRPRNPAQAMLIHLLGYSRVVISSGPAGTGKTFIAIGHAVSLFKSNQIKKIVIARPAVEAGEKIGFLPGDIQSKMDPYMRPIYDAFHEMLGIEETEKLIERGVIEIVTFGFMRGRTFKDCFVFADEIQNATVEQAKMIVTRLGPGSSMYLNGDPMQIDLPLRTESGLNYLVQVLENVPGFAVHRFTASDVVRDPLVLEAVRAFEQHSLLYPKY
jgi:phosphate starvation-inducible PhoH-like protein